MAAPQTCPHCGSTLRAILLPLEAGFNDPVHCACFNDDCSYFKEGWEWMREQYAVNSSYRYRIDPATNTASPLPVWSSEALRDRIIEET